METIYVELMKLFPHINVSIASGSYVFARLLGFFRFAPVFNRKELPGMIKISLVLLLTAIITPFLKPETMVGTSDSFALSLLLNFAVG
ncbi:flagellar biosynthetic protein FliR, partial [bacterium]|nr:flagellar biosynthetic protein FliR [bacterium]